MSTPYQGYDPKIPYSRAWFYGNALTIDTNQSFELAEEKAKVLFKERNMVGAMELNYIQSIDTNKIAETDGVNRDPATPERYWYNFIVNS